MEGEKIKILVALSRKLEVAHQAYLKSLRGAQFEVVSCDDVDELIALAQQGPALFVIGTKTKFADVAGHDLIRRLGELDPPPTAPALVLQDPSVSVSKLPETSISILQRWSQARESLGLTQSRAVPKAPPKIKHKQVNIESTDQTLDMAFGAPKKSGSALGGVGDGDVFDPSDISGFSPLTITKLSEPSAPSEKSPEAPTGEDGVIELTESDRIPSEESAAFKLAAESKEAPRDEEGGSTEDLPFGIEPPPGSGEAPSDEEEKVGAKRERPSYTPPSPDSIVAADSAEAPDGELSTVIHDDATEDLEFPPVHVPESRLPDKTEEVEPGFVFGEASASESSDGPAHPASVPVAAPAPVPASAKSSKSTTLKFAIIGIVGLIMTVTGFGIIFFASEDGDGSGGGTVVTPLDQADAGPVVDAAGDGGIVATADEAPTELAVDGGMSTEGEQPEEIVLPIKFRRRSYDPYSVRRRDIRGIVDMIKSNPRVQFELIGYASTDETKSGSKILGLRRAKRARDVLCMHGPSRTRFKTTSGGASNPVIDEDGNELVEKSRRVVIREIVAQDE